MASDYEKALYLILCIQEAINQGTKHFTVDGKPLNTVDEVLAEFHAGRGVRVVEPTRVHISKN